jgi:amino acid transporter/mannitol/fructose-specific phosphotransferase system IIA component (Ntr-type)
MHRKLALLDVFSVSMGAMLGAGIFLLPGLAYGRVGPAFLISYLFAGLLAVCGMVSQAELVSAMPRAGGTYFYVTRALGPGVGTVDGLLTWLSFSLKSAFALVGMATVLRLLLPAPVELLALALCAFFILLNLIGAKQAGRAQAGLVGVVLPVMLLYVVRGLPSVAFDHLVPFAPQGVGTILTTAGFVFISYGGLLKVAGIAEEVRNPSRNLPLGMLLSLAAVMVLYFLVALVTVGVVPASQLTDSLSAIQDGAANLVGAWARIPVNIAAVLAFISAANAGILSSSRYPLALARDGLLPGFLARVNPRFRTPHVSVLVTGAVMSCAVLLKLETLVKAASTVFILIYAFSCLSIVILRESRLQNYQPRFRAPLYPVFQVVGLIGFGFLLATVGGRTLLVSALLASVAVFIYWFYGRIRASKDYALLYLIERVTAKELTSRLLEEELKHIIKERDQILADRFDRLVHECPVLDIDEEMSSSEFFRVAAEAISPDVRLPPSEVAALLEERERASSTAISPTVAIPHVVLPGENAFDILLARCRKGIRFSDAAPNVRAVFVFVGTGDERNFHLRALAAVAQIVQDSHFEKRWAAARGVEELRDLVLLAERRRR